jgi:protein-S-isoprenylcysteine O-methyltransferase Ste14
MHPFNEPATVRDVLEARNFIAHTIINAANVLLSIVLCLGMVGFGEIAERHYRGWWVSWLPIVLAVISIYFLRIKTPQLLTESAEALEAAPTVDFD